MKKTRWLYDKNKYFLKIPLRDTVGPISRWLKHHNWQGVSQYLWWVLYFWDFWKDFWLIVCVIQ
jgi:hypothetical protein